MADNSVKLNPKTLQTMSELTNVRRISDLDVINIYNINGDEIRTSTEFDNSYLLSSTLLNEKYYNYRVKLNELTQYIHDLSMMELATFRKTFDYFVQTLRDNTALSYVKMVPSSGSIDSSDPDVNYAYTFEYMLSSIQSNDIFPFTYFEYADDEHEEVRESSYAYTNALTNGLVTSYVMEQYVRNTLGRILGVPSTPAYISEAVDSVIEFVDWFSGYVRTDTSYGSLQRLINTIEMKDAEVLNEAKSYTVENRELAYAYTEFNRELAYNYIDEQISNVDVDVPVKGVSDSDISITIGSTTYTLQLDSNKKLKLAVDVDNYTSITLKNVTSSPDPVSSEYKSSITASTISLSATASKPCSSSTEGWIVKSGNNATISNKAVSGRTYTATGNYGPIELGTSTDGITYSWTISVTEQLTDDERQHGHTTAKSAEATVNVTHKFNKYKVFVFASPLEISNITISETNQQPKDISQQSIMTYGGVYKIESSLPSSFGSFQVDSNDGDCYIYFLVPTAWTSSSKGFKWRGTETLPETPGSNNINNKTLYGNSVSYKLYRSGNKYPSGTSINMKYTT